MTRGWRSRLWPVDSSRRGGGFVTFRPILWPVDSSRSILEDIEAFYHADTPRFLIEWCTVPMILPARVALHPARQRVPHWHCRQPRRQACDRCRHVLVDATATPWHLPLPPASLCRAA